MIFSEAAVCRGNETARTPMRRHVLRALGAACALVLASTAGTAQDYPNRTIRVVVPYAAGQATDVMCRVFIEQLKGALKQNIVIENKAGAGTNIGAASVAKAAPDGYTLLCTGNATTVANPLLYASLGFDPDRELAPISAIAATGYLVLAGPDYKGKSLQDFLAVARKADPPLLVGLASTTATVIYGMVREAAKVPLARVPYPAGNMTLFPDLLRGQTHLVIEAMPSAVGFLSGGGLAPLGVTLPSRSKLLPDVPTLRESGVDVTLVGWNAFYAPGGTPPEIISVLSRASIEALNHPAVAKALETIACVPMPTTPEELRRITKEDREKWLPMVKLLDLKAN
jgi:tripartite-type tricarboxylate transporter receptor subunit TctC